MPKNHRLKKWLNLLLTGIGVAMIAVPLGFALDGWTTNLSNGEMTYDVQKMNQNPTWSETDLACSTGYMQHWYELLTVNTSNRDYWTTVHAFAMALDTTYDSSYMSEPGTPSTNDFLSTVDTTNLSCTLGDDIYHDCGFNKDTDLGQVIASGPQWGGTSITYQRLGFLPGNPRGLVWRYSTSDTGNTDNTPWLHARNSSSQSPPQLVETIWMEPENYSQYQTATTESYALVEHWYQNQTSNNWYQTFTQDVDSDNDNRTHDEPFDVDPDHDFAYWYGAVGARLTFDDCENECTDLDITSPTSISAANAGNTQPLTIDVDDEDGAPWDGTYTYTSSNPNSNPNTCQFRRGNFGQWRNPLTSTAETVNVRNCTPGEIIEVHENSAPLVCNDSLEIGDACASISMTPATTIPVENVDPYITININNPTAASGGWWSGRYRYSATNENGGASTCRFTISESNANNQTNGVPTIWNTYRRTMYAYNCSPGDTLFTTEINHSLTCNDSVDIAPLPPTYCGDGIQQTPNDDGQNEECDDGNSNNNDSCQNDCTIPPTLTYCGDGIEQHPNDDGQDEECDDGNSNNNDYCQNDCTLPPPPTYCGDGIPQHPNDDGQDEECDDGNSNNNDYCQNDCTLPPPPLFCENLTIIEPTSIEPEQAGDLTAIAISVEDNEGNTWDGSYTYWTDAGNCEFRETPEFEWTTALSTTAEIVEVQNCEPGDEIFVTENNHRDTCRDSLAIDNPCNTLNITTPADLTPAVIAAQPFQLSFESLGLNKENIPGIFEITAENIDGGASSCQFYSTEERANNETSGNSSMTTTLHNVWVNECELGDTITVQDTNARICVDQISGTPDTTPTYCGDGIPQNPNDDGQNEACDDGNTVDDDACSNTCELPPPVIDQCIGLQIDPTDVAQQSLPQLFTITSDPTTWPGPWTWESRRLNGDRHGNFVANDGALVGNPITTNDRSVGFYGGAENDHITVTNTNDAACYAEANIIGNTGTCVNNCGGGTPPGGGGGETYCGDGIKQSPNERRNVYEECDEGAGGLIETGPNAGLWCNNCQLQNTCDTIEKVYPIDPTIDYLPGGIDLEVQAQDGLGNEWNNPDTATYNWRILTTSEQDAGGFRNANETGTFTPTLATNEGKITFKKSADQTSSSIQVGVDSPGFPACYANYRINFPQPEDTLEKKVTTWNFGFMELQTTSINGSCFDSDEENCPDFGHDLDYALYELTYTPNPNPTEPVTITDDIKDEIIGSDGGSITSYTPNNQDKLAIQEWTYNKSMYVYLDKETHKEQLHPCLREDPTSSEITSTETCYTEDIARQEGLTLHNLKDATPIKIRYIGRVANGKFFSCTAPPDATCPVQGFTNTAITSTGRQASADLTIICPYLLTRNAGDVYLGSDLRSYDLSCYYPDTHNSDGLVLGRRTLANPFRGLKSYIKQVVFDLQTVWNQTTIENAVATYNTQAVTRNNKDVLKNLPPANNPNDGVKLTNFGDLANLDLYKTSKQNVYEINGTNLTMALTDEVPAGAYTFIVRNANLNIRKNIEYATLPSNNGNFTINNPKEIPSIAFIVINGDINVENNPPQTEVTKMAGVYYVQNGEITGDWTGPFTSLTIQGSVYGNINPLLKARTFAGPANYDQGNVVIRYDERIILNTPPGLEDYVDVQSERVAR